MSMRVRFQCSITDIGPIAVSGVVWPQFQDQNSYIHDMQAVPEAVCISVSRPVGKSGKGALFYTYLHFSLGWRYTDIMSEEGRRAPVPAVF